MKKNTFRNKIYMEKNVNREKIYTKIEIQKTGFSGRPPWVLIILRIE